MGAGLSCNFMDTVVNGNHITVAVVMAIVLMTHVVPWVVWQMLWQQLCCCSVCGRCKAILAGVMATYVEQVAGVIANVADGMATWGGSFY